jgi:hypothetical protein
MVTPDRLAWVTLARSRTGPSAGVRTCDRLCFSPGGGAAGRDAGGAEEDVARTGARVPPGQRGW